MVISQIIECKRFLSYDETQSNMQLFSESEDREIDETARLPTVVVKGHCASSSPEGTHTPGPTRSRATTARSLRNHFRCSRRRCLRRYANHQHNADRHAAAKHRSAADCNCPTDHHHCAADQHCPIDHHGSSRHRCTADHRGPTDHYDATDHRIDAHRLHRGILVVIVEPESVAAVKDDDHFEKLLLDLPGPKGTWLLMFVEMFAPEILDWTLNRVMVRADM